MKIAVIGAGISGLSFGRLCKKNQKCDVVIFEKMSKPGGIARVKDENGIPYHVVGGHCFNSKFPEVRDFVFNEVLEENSWNKVERSAEIIFKGHSIPYPIEFSLKELYKVEPALSLSIIKDFIDAQYTKKESSNLGDWFINNFGYTLASEYLIPYNKKIWGRDPNYMSQEWVIDKLPQPSYESFLKGLIDSAQDKMPHQYFYYPKNGSQNTFIEALSEGLDIRYNSNIDKLTKLNGKFVIHGEEFDKVIFTGPLNQISQLWDGSFVAEKTEKLKFNKVTTMLWSRKETKHTWTYLPDAEILYHRMIHIGNFVRPQTNYSICEAVGERSYEEMLEAGKKIDILLEPIDYNVSNHAYVVFDKEHGKVVNEIKSALKDDEIYPLGRFGEWEYYNMDICIKSSMQLIKELNIE